MSEKSHQSFTKIEVWKKARIFKNEMFVLAKLFSPEEKYKLTDQLISASRSIYANIAEGHGRYTYKDQLHFCIQSRGSLSECYNHLIDAFDCKYMTELQLNNYKSKVNEIERLLNG